VSKTAKVNPTLRWLATYTDDKGVKYSKVLKYTTKAAVEYRLQQDGFIVLNVSKQNNNE